MTKEPNKKLFYFSCHFLSHSIEKCFLEFLYKKLFLKRNIQENKGEERMSKGRKSELRSIIERKKEL